MKNCISIQARLFLQLFLILMYLVFVNSSMALITYDDGGIHEISTYISDTIAVYDGPTQPTTVNVIAGGELENVYIYENSILSMNNGACVELYGYDNAQIDLHDSTVNVGLNVYDNSTLFCAGTTISMGIGTYGFSMATFEDSEIFLSLYALENSSVHVNSLQVSFITIRNNASLELEDLTGLGGPYVTFDLEDFSQLIIWGTDFEINGNLISPGTYTGSSLNIFTTGNLEYTTPSGLENQFIFDTLSSDATIILIPEPASFLLFGLSTLILRKRN